MKFLIIKHFKYLGNYWQTKAAREIKVNWNIYKKYYIFWNGIIRWGGKWAFLRLSSGRNAFFIDFILSVRMIEGFRQEVLCRYGNEPWKKIHFNYRLRLGIMWKLTGIVDCLDEKWVYWVELAWNFVGI